MLYWDELYMTHAEGIARQAEHTTQIK